MKAIINTGTPFNPRLEVAEKSMPQLSANDVLVKVHASSVNPKDWKLNLNMSRIHALRSPGSRPALFGDDLAGVVVEVGSAVTQFKPGDEVYGMDMRLRTAALAEYARIATKRIALNDMNAGAGLWWCRLHTYSHGGCRAGRHGVSLTS